MVVKLVIMKCLNQDNMIDPNLIKIAELQLDIKILGVLIGFLSGSFVVYIMWSLEKIMELKALSKDLLVSCYMFLNSNKLLRRKSIARINNHLYQIAADNNFGDIYKDVIDKE